MKRTIRRLKTDLKNAGITQDRIAAQSGVTRTMVNKVLNEKAVSRKVVAAAQYLLALNGSAA